MSVMPTSRTFKLVKTSQQIANTGSEKEILVFVQSLMEELGVNQLNKFLAGLYVKLDPFLTLNNINNLYKVVNEFRTDAKHFWQLK